MLNGLWAFMYETVFHLYMLTFNDGDPKTLNKPTRAALERRSTYMRAMRLSPQHEEHRQLEKQALHHNATQFTRCQAVDIGEERDQMMHLARFGP